MTKKRFLQLADEVLDGGVDNCGCMHPAVAPHERELRTEVKNEIMNILKATKKTQMFLGLIDKYEYDENELLDRWAINNGGSYSP